MNSNVYDDHVPNHELLRNLYHARNVTAAETILVSPSSPSNQTFHPALSTNGSHDPSQILTHIYQDVLSSPLMPLIVSIGLYLLTAIITYVEYRDTFSLDYCRKRRERTNTSRASSSSPSPNPQDELMGGTMMSRSRRFPTTLLSSSGSSSAISSKISRNATRDHVSPSNPYGSSRDNGSSPQLLQGGSNMSSPSFRARGELQRRLFYRFLLYSLLLRTICLPLGYLFFEAKEQITSIVSWTLPTVSSALANLMLVLFLGQVLATIHGKHDSEKKLLHHHVAQGSYVVYAVIVGLNCIVPVLTGRILLLTLWCIFCGVFLGLFVSMSMYSFRVIHALNGSMPWAVASRLMVLSIVCSLIFLLRSVMYGWDTYSGIVGEKTQGITDDIFGDEMTFYRTVVGYLLLELFPAWIVLSLMHRNRSSQQPEEDEVAARMDRNKFTTMGLGVGDDAQGDSMMHLVESGTLGGISSTGGGTHEQSPPILDSIQEPSPRHPYEGGFGGGVRRSFSANGGVAAPLLVKSVRGSISHSQPLQPAYPSYATGQQPRRMVGGIGMNDNDASRLVSGGTVRQQQQQQETVSLLVGSKSDGVQGSMSSPSYGAMNS